jgi:hypothetical protein
MKKIFGLTILGLIILMACNYLNVVTMTDVNTGLDLLGNPYFLEGYGKGDMVLIVENNFYEVLGEIKIK